MRNIYNIIWGVVLIVCSTACNKEWEDEQYLHMASFKANVNDQGVTTTYVRFKPGGVVKYDLPVIMSGSTMTSQSHTIHFALDPDTLERLNIEQYGHREELYFQQLPSKYYSMPESVEMPAGECLTTLPIEFKLDETLDQADKWVLPIQILGDQSYDYQINPRKYYRRAMLRLLPFNDYSGTYDGSQFKITLEGQKDPFTVTNHKAYVHDDNTVFVYMGLRDVDYIDRKCYKLYMEFTKEKITPLKYKLRLWTDNGGTEGNNFKELNGKIGNVEYEQPYYTVVEEYDAVKPYLKHIYITLYLAYTFEDYTLSPGNRLKYTVEGTLNMQRDLNTLIPDEDQQIQWD